MGKYGNWWRTRIGLGCLFGIRYVFFNLLLCLPPVLYTYVDVVSVADKRSFDGKIPFKNEIVEE